MLKIVKNLIGVELMIYASEIILRTLSIFTYTLGTRVLYLSFNEIELLN